MKHVTLSVPDKLYNTILSLFRYIPEVTIKEEADFDVPAWQKKIVRQRIKNAKPGNFKPYAEVRKSLKKKHGL